MQPVGLRSSGPIETRCGPSEFGPGPNIVWLFGSFGSEKTISGAKRDRHTIDDMRPATTAMSFGLANRMSYWMIDLLTCYPSIPSLQNVEVGK